VAVSSDFNLLDASDLSETLDLRSQITKLYYENAFLKANRKPFNIGDAYSLPPVEDVNNNDEYVFVRQFLRETKSNEVEDRHLVVLNEYATVDNQYANGFVHRRIKQYQNSGMRVDVLVCKRKQLSDVYVYDGVTVLTGYINELLGVLASRRYKSVSVHFLTFEMWRCLQSNLPESTNLIVYVHGYEVRNWVRIPWEISNRDNLNAQIERSLQIEDTWKSIFDINSRVDRFVFPSEWWLKAVEEDMGLVIRKSIVIPNVVDTELFNYVEKDPDQRKNLLWVRNGRKFNYAADVAAEILRRLAETPVWESLKITLVGDGKYFEEFNEFRDCENVKIIDGYISQQEISRLHKQHGLLLVPTRFDTQGVSRDEGMSSGLIPITSPVAAVPEFVNDSVAILGSEDDFDTWLERIISVIDSPSLFAEYSRKAAEHIRSLRPIQKTIGEEMTLMKKDRVKC